MSQSGRIILIISSVSFNFRVSRLQLGTDTTQLLWNESYLLGGSVVFTSKEKGLVA